MMASSETNLYVVLATLPLLTYLEDLMNLEGKKVVFMLHLIGNYNHSMDGSICPTHEWGVFLRM